MENIVIFLKIIPVLIAAILIGNWFLADYVSIPGLLILLAILIIPIVLWLMSH